jgi:DNA primase
MADNVEQIKEKLSIEEVVSWYVQLKPAGSSLKARCPFHAEKTPSFVVSPVRGTYHCFGCGVGGDMFSFVQAIEGVDFKGALTTLAERAGVTLTFDKNTPRSDKDVLYAIVEDAVQLYETHLRDNKPAREYLLARGLSDETITKFRLGFAPDSWDAAYTYLRSKKYSDADIERAGLIKKSEKPARSGGSGYYDRFRSRIMFPINDSVGRPVGFSGRIFGDDTDSAKYINSPETELYDKSSILFGFDRAKQAMRRNKFVVLVEGQMDLLLSHHIHYANTLALSGTALTSNQVRAIGRLTKNMVIALDADTAGIDATRKSARAALLAGFDVKVTTLPDGKDPADVIKEQGAEGWKGIIKHAVHVIPFLFAYTRAHTKDDRAFALRATKEVLPFITYIESPVDRAHFVRVSARELAVPEHVIEAELARVRVEPDTKESTTIQAPIAPKAATTAQEHALQFLRWRQGVGSAEHFRTELVRVLGEPVVTQAEATAADTGTFFVLEEMYDEKSIETAQRDIVHRLEREVLLRLF